MHAKRKLAVAVLACLGLACTRYESRDHARAETAFMVAERAARRTDGVRDVRNLLMVEAKSAAAAEGRSIDKAISDAALTASVKTSLADEPGVKAGGIDVDTAHGVVTLQGRVGSSAEARLAEQTARKVSGVRDVVNYLRVSSS